MGENDGLPPDPVSEMAAAAASMHEVFEAYKRAGFSPGESLQIVIAIMTSGMT